jgi:5'-3' exonuclease
MCPSRGGSLSHRRGRYECFKSAVDVTPEMAHRTIQVLRARGYDCITAPYEADAQLAFLAREGHIDYVITEDSDLVPFGTPRILYKLGRAGDPRSAQLFEVPRPMPLISLSVSVSLQHATHTACLTRFRAVREARELGAARHAGCV